MSWELCCLGASPFLTFVTYGQWRVETAPPRKKRQNVERFSFCFLCEKEKSLISHNFNLTKVRKGCLFDFQRMFVEY